MKRLVSFFFSAILMITTLLSTAGAIECNMNRASDYFSARYVWINSDGDKTITIGADITAIDIMSELGIKEIEIQKLTLGKWMTVDTIRGTTKNGMLETSTDIYNSSCEYSCAQSGTYRAIVTVYAKNRSGSDSVSMTTNSVAA